MDKRWARRAPADPEDWYRQAVTAATHVCARHWPALHTDIDKRYTKETLRQQLEAKVRAGLEGLICRLEIDQRDSRTRRGLRMADYVAWAIRQKYEANEMQYYEIIRGRIIGEILLQP